MSETLISRSADLARLETDGLRLQVVQGTADHLLIHGIPAVTATREVVLGTLYCPLELGADGKTSNPVPNHQCWWIGEAPCDHTGRLMAELIANPQPENKGDGITTTVGFSRKPIDKSPWPNVYEKIWAYIEHIWHEARVIDPICDPRADKPVPVVVEALKRVFHYPDMATTRAGIGAATAKLLAERVAIVGLGGTGSYVLDLLAKTPVAEIHTFDRDTFDLHNAFRASGAPAIDDFKPDLKKVDWFGSIYDRMRSGIIRHPYHIDGTNLAELAGFDFVFVAVDNAEARKLILEGLIAIKVPFIDTGMDLDLDKNSSLHGICRLTVGMPDYHNHIKDVVPLSNAPAADVYRNIQVSDLNMLSAAMAVIKWKKIRGFYVDDVREHHSLYTVSTHALTKEDLSEDPRCAA